MSMKVRRLLFLVGWMQSLYQVLGGSPSATISPSTEPRAGPLSPSDISEESEAYSPTSNPDSQGGVAELIDIESMFNESDLDGSGELDYEEFEKLMNTFGSPSKSPTMEPSLTPSNLPSSIPTFRPTGSVLPSSTPTTHPSSSWTPSANPNPSPSIFPTIETEAPIVSPTPSPTAKPTLVPTDSPSESMDPSHKPSRAPSIVPTRETNLPSVSPTLSLTAEPTSRTSVAPSITLSDEPSLGRSSYPSLEPEVFVAPSGRPSIFTNNPKGSISPSNLPTRNPKEPVSKSLVPADDPTGAPVSLRSIHPSSSPTEAATSTNNNITSTGQPEVPSASPSVLQTSRPTKAKDTTETPSISIQPSNMPSGSPTKSLNPSSVPTIRPSVSISPSETPSGNPSDTKNPSVVPSQVPSLSPRQLFANTTIILRGVTGMMDDNAIAKFEEIGLLLLDDRFPLMESFVLDFLFIQATGQVFEYEDREAREGDLTVYVRIAANIIPGEPNGFDFQWSMESFFEVHMDLLTSRLGNDGVIFQTSSIQGDGVVQNSQAEDEEESWANFFTTNVIVGISVSMASVLVVGAFIISRPVWRRSNGYPMGSPGRLGATPSYDSEENLDPQSIFFSFSQGSTKQGTSNQIGTRSVGSYYNSSTSGSHLAGLEIDNYLSSTSVDSKSRGNQQKKGKSAHRNRAEDFEDIRSKTNSILDDLESQMSELSGIKDSVEVEWDGGRSKHPSIPTIEESSSSDSSARQRKRTLEQKFENRRRKLGSKGMQTLLENEQLDGAPSSGFSMKDFIMPSCSLGGEVYPSASYRAQFNSMLSPDSDQSSSIIKQPPIMDQMPPFELYEQADRILVEETPQYSGENIYGQMNNVARPVPEENREINQEEEDTNNSFSLDRSPLVDADNSPSQDVDKKKTKSSIWFRKGQAAKKPTVPNPSNNSLSLFGRKKKTNPWEENVDFSPISPNKRYRRGQRGQLVPRRFHRDHSVFEDEDSHVASSADGADGEMDDPSIVLLPGTSSESAGTGSAPKARPPMLNLNELEESVYSEDQDAAGVMAESPLHYHAGVGIHINAASAMTYGRGMLYGHDPDGFALTNATKKLPEYMDPPTASEHRRTVAAAAAAQTKNNETKKPNNNKSALRTKDSPRRLSKEDRVSFSERDDTVLLVADESRDSSTAKLRWEDSI